jgi:hypothetical protein
MEVSVIGGDRCSYSMLRKFAQEVQFHVNIIDFQLHNELTSLKVYLALVPKNVLTLGWLYVSCL